MQVARLCMLGSGCGGFEGYLRSIPRRGAWIMACMPYTRFKPALRIRSKAPGVFWAVPVGLPVLHRMFFNKGLGVRL